MLFFIIGKGKKKREQKKIILKENISLKNEQQSNGCPKEEPVLHIANLKHRSVFLKLFHLATLLFYPRKIFFQTIFYQKLNKHVLYQSDFELIFIHRS